MQLPLISLSAKESFINGLPYFPYCTNDLGYGIKKMPRDMAIKRRNIQHNPSCHIRAVAFDIDNNNGTYHWYDVGAPEPNYVTVNPDNGHSHLIYMLNVPVTTTEAGRAKPRFYLEAIERGLSDLLSADVGYVGLITKNPLHDDWNTYTPRKESYTLDELGEYVDLTIPKPRKRELDGLGRNNRLFDDLRFWCYKHINNARDNMNFEQWCDVVASRSEKLNSFENPLMMPEIRATSKSVAKWTWDKYTGKGDSKNRGVCLKQIELWGDALDLSDRQRIGQQHTSQKRIESTENRIKLAVKTLRSNDARVSIRSVAKATALSKTTVQKHNNLLA